jgi:hypothetical protein
MKMGFELLTTSTEASADTIYTDTSFNFIRDDFTAFGKTPSASRGVIQFHGSRVPCCSCNSLDGKRLTVNYNGFAIPEDGSSQLCKFVKETARTDL